MGWRVLRHWQPCSSSSVLVIIIIPVYVLLCFAYYFLWLCITTSGGTTLFYYLVLFLSYLGIIEKSLLLITLFIYKYIFNILQCYFFSSIHKCILIGKMQLMPLKKKLCFFYMRFLRVIVYHVHATYLWGY